MSGWEGARRPLAMHPDFLFDAVDHVFFKLRDVMANIIDKVHLQLLPRSAEDVREDLARLPHEELAIAPGEVRGRAHRSDVLLPFRAVDRGTGQLAVRQDNAVFFRSFAQELQG